MRKVPWNRTKKEKIEIYFFPILNFYMLKKEEIVTIIHLRSGKKWVKPLSGEFSTQYGKIDLDKCVGKEEGITITSNSGEKFSVFRALPSEYILKMKRKAQIIYPKDSAHILFDVLFPKEKCFIFEIGCGSGGLTIPLANILKKSFLISVDKRKEFLKRCKKNLEKYCKNKNNISLILADAKNLPFKNNLFDVMCIDMVDPWEYIEEFEKISKKGSLFFFYLTNITQILEWYKKIKGRNFTDIAVFEILKRDWKINDRIARPKERMVGHTGFIIRARRYYEM